MSKDITVTLPYDEYQRMLERGSVERAMLLKTALIISKLERTMQLQQSELLSKLPFSVSVDNLTGEPKIHKTKHYEEY